jgi:hypothetical protein
MLFTHARLAEFPALELLAIQFFAKRPLAPATKKSYGEAGVLLASGYGGPKIFPKPCESCRCYGG